MSEQHGDRDGEHAPGWSGEEPPRTIDVTPQDEGHAHASHGKRLWPVLALVVIVVAILGTSPYWTQILPWSPQAASNAQKAQIDQHDQQLSELAQQQSTLDQRLAHLEQQMKSVATPQWMQEEAQAMRALSDRVTALQSRAPDAADQKQLAALNETIKKLQDTVGVLDQRLDRLEARRETVAMARSEQALLLAVGQLRAAIDRGRGFSAELDTVKALGRDRPELSAPVSTLAPAAAQGIPSVAMLTQRFRDEVAPAVLHAPEADAAPAPSDSLGARILARLRALVTIRRVADRSAGAGAGGDAVSIAVGRTEAALAQGDLAGAVSALSALTSQQRAPAQEWLAAAHRRLDAEDALDKLTADLTARLASAPGATPSPTPAQAAPPAPAAAGTAPQH